MEATYSYHYQVLPTVCGRDLKLTVPDAFGVFQDAATLHADGLGVGLHQMAARGLFWLAAKTKVHILRRPGFLETVQVTTRPLVPDRIRSVREYRMTAGDELLIEGKTEWAVIELPSGKLHPMADVFPSGVELAPAAWYAAPFARIRPDLTGAEPVGTYKVRSCDIDSGEHMNNVAYLRAVFGLFSCKELETLPQNEVEIVFRTPCYEGETLTVLRRDGELFVTKPDGTVAAMLAFQ